MIIFLEPPNCFLKVANFGNGHGYVPLTSGSFSLVKFVVCYEGGRLLDHCTRLFWKAFLGLRRCDRE